MRSLLAIVAWCYFFWAYSQTPEEQLEKQIDEVTYNWDLEADKLSTYAGLLFVCSDKTYRTEIISLLNEIHHLDSVLYEVLQELSLTDPDREIRKTLREIESFELNYDTKNFIRFMGGECKASKEIEKNAEDTKNEVGETSYSGQVYILETELFKYVNQVTRRVDKIRTHVHHLISHYE